MLNRRALLVLAAAPFAASSAARAQGGWPDRPIRLIVGFPAGGPTDFAARVLQDPLQQLWGQPIVIENRPGASQNIAAEAVAKAAPDGYTLLLCTSNITTNPAVFARLPYDVERDFTPIVIVYSSPTVLFTGRGQPFRSVKDVVEAAKRSPGMAAATSGIATSGHFATEMFMRAAGVELTHVPYRGASPALQDVVGGRVPITFSTLSGAIGLAREGLLRPLAIAAPRTAKALPGVPTMAEAGFPGVEVGSGVGLVAPAGTPPGVIDTLHRAIADIIATPGFKERMAAIGVDTVGTTPQEYARIIREEYAKWGKVVEAAGIKPE